METFIIFQANKNNVCAGIKFWILFHNAAWLSVPEHPAVHSVLRVDTVRAGGKQHLTGGSQEKCQRGGNA